jgi:hypothetical protein
MCRILVGADRYASTEPAANTPRSSIPRGWWRRALSLPWAASATVMTMLSPRRSRSLQGRDHPSARAMAVIRSRRVRDAGMGGLVQQPAALGAHRQHPAGRSRGTLLRHAGTTCHGGVTQTKWLPTNPGRFTALNKMYGECRQADRFCCAQIQPAQAIFDERLLLLVWLSSSSRGPTNRDNRNCSEGFVDSFHVTVSCAVDSSGIEPAGVLNNRRPRVSSSSSLNG